MKPAGEGLDMQVRPPRIALAFALAVLAYWGGGMLPFDANASPVAARLVLAVTTLTATCWLVSAMPIGAASLLPVVFLPVLGVQSTAEVTRAYTNPILWLFGGGFVLAKAIEKWGLHRRLALQVMGFVGPHPRRIVAGFMLVATFLSLWISNTAVALMLLPIGWALVDRTAAEGALSGRYQKAFAGGVMLAIAYGASIGGMGSPIGTAPNALFLKNYQGLVDAGAPALTFLQWLLAFVPFVFLVSLLFSFLLTRFVLPLPGGRMQGGDRILAEGRSLGAMSRAERRVAWLFSVAVALWVTRADVRLGEDFVIHGWAWWVQPEHTAKTGTYIHDACVAVGVAIVSFLVPAGTGDGRRLMDWETARTVPFDILFLLGAGMALADAFEPTGLSRAVGNLVAPMVGTTHPLAVIAVLAVAMLVLSEIASNTAVAAVFLPILKDSAVAAEVDPRSLMLPAALAASCGFMLPIATPPNTIVFASGKVSIGQMIRCGLLLDLVATGLLVVWLWIWVLPFLGIDPTGAPDWLPK